MINSLKQFIADVKATSKYLWYVVKFFLYVLGISLSFALLNAKSTLVFILGALLFVFVFVICVIRTTRVIKNWFNK